MIKLNFKYQGAPFLKGNVNADWKDHPDKVSSLVARLSKHEPMGGELVLHYENQGPTYYQIEALNGVAPQKIVRLFSKMGFRPFVD